MRYSRYGLLLALPLAGCNTSTGILPAGPDSFTVTETVSPLRGGGAEAERVAMMEANEYCEQQKRVFVPDVMNPAGNLSSPYGPDGYAVTFRCLLPNDPAVAAFKLQRGPNTPSLPTEPRPR